MNAAWTVRAWVPTGSSNRVNRGGSWNNTSRNCRSANRNRNEPGNRNTNIGFRPSIPSHDSREPSKDGFPVLATARSTSRPATAGEE
jgi:hypothetical protein